MGTKKNAARSGRKKKATPAEIPAGCTGEIIGIILTVLVLGLFISIASYSPEDWPNSTAPATENLCGAVGAYTAYKLMFLVGYSSYLIVAWFALAALRQFKPAPLLQRVIETGGFVVAIFSLSLLLSRWLEPISGGILGAYLVYRGGQLLGDWGSVLVALGGLLCAVVMVTRLSMRDVLVGVGSGTTQLWRGSMATSRALIEQYRKNLDDRRAQFGSLDQGDRKYGKIVDAVESETKPRPFRKNEKPTIHKPDTPAAGEREKPSAAAGKEKVIPIDRKRRAKPKPSEAAAATPEESAAPELTTMALPEGYDPETYELPTLDMLPDIGQVAGDIDDKDMLDTSDLIISTLAQFGVEARVNAITPGPAVTMYELEPAPGVPVSKIKGRDNDLMMALAAKTIRIIAPIRGKSAVGIEVPNRDRQIVGLKEIIQSKGYQACDDLLKIALGKDNDSKLHFLKLDKMPHLLIAGQTNSGKSICIHSLIVSLLFNAAPHQLKFVMVDPKMVELPVYKDIPHLLAPVITDPKEATRSLHWLTEEMDKRYEVLLAAECRDIGAYNEMREAEGKIPMPYIVLIIDELFDLMAIGQKECEGYIARLASKARAIGIHLVLATQRPSVDVITGVIKANLPARIALSTITKVESRVIMEQSGAEELLGKGDMMFMDPNSPIVIRMQGTFVDGPDIKRVVEFIRDQGKPKYNTEVVAGARKEIAIAEGCEEGDWEYYEVAKEYVIKSGKGSIAMLQRALRVSHPRARRLMEQLENDGIVGPDEGPKARKVLVAYEDYYGAEGSGGGNDSGEDEEA